MAHVLLVQFHQFVEGHTFVTHPSKWHVNVLSILHFATQHIFWGISYVHVNVMWRLFCPQTRKLCVFTWPLILRVASCVNTIHLKIFSSSSITFSIFCARIMYIKMCACGFKKTWLVVEHITLNLICLSSPKCNYYGPSFSTTIHIYTGCCTCKCLG